MAKKDIQSWLKADFPLSHNFYLSAHVSFARVNKIEAMYGKSRVNVKFEPRSTFTFARDFPYIASILFTHVRTKKVHENGIHP